MKVICPVCNSEMKLIDAYNGSNSTVFVYTCYSCESSITLFIPKDKLKS